MNKYPAYHITHIFFNNQFTLPATGESNKGNYLVFWWKDIALGQLFVEPNETFSQKEFYQAVVKAVAPSIDFYATGKKGVTQDEWQNLLLNGQFTGLAAWMDILFKQWENVHVPASVPVSLIICTRNRVPHLKRCLQMLDELTCRPAEIIVVDNNPSDISTETLVATFKSVTYLKEPRAGLSFARNTGILHAGHPFIAFTDDDATVHPLWIYHLYETFRDSSVAAMTGLVISLQLETGAQAIFEKHWTFNKGYTDIRYDNEYFKANYKIGVPVWEIGAGVNMAFRRSIFDEIGLFDERLGAGASGCSEDSEVWFRILLKGYTMHYNPRAIVYHEHRKDMPGLKKQIFSYMRGFTAAALFQQQYHPESGYKIFKLRGFIKQYSYALIKQFPHYPLQYKTLLPEIKGVLSGLLFYYKNKKKPGGFK